MRSGTGHLSVSFNFSHIQIRIDLIGSRYFLPISVVASIWPMSVHAPLSNRLYSNARTNARAKTTMLVPFAVPMAMFIALCANWSRKRVARVWWPFRWRIVRQPLIAMPIVIKRRHHLSALPTINCIVPNAICAKRIAANTCSLYQWNAVWPHSHSKDVPKYVHKNSNRCAAVTARLIPTNASSASKNADHEMPFNCNTMDRADDERSPRRTIYIKRKINSTWMITKNNN